MSLSGGVLSDVPAAVDRTGSAARVGLRLVVDGPRLENKRDRLRRSIAHPTRSGPLHRRDVDIGEFEHQVFDRTACASGLLQGYLAGGNDRAVAALLKEDRAGTVSRFHNGEVADRNFARTGAGTGAHRRRVRRSPTEGHDVNLIRVVLLLRLTLNAVELQKCIVRHKKTSSFGILSYRDGPERVSPFSGPRRQSELSLILPTPANPPRALETPLARLIGSAAAGRPPPGTLQACRVRPSPRSSPRARGTWTWRRLRHCRPAARTWRPIG